ncbi:C40 family peptidase [Frankia sp. Cj5]|uniref:C40 family peptidase n=1 Tax=Frankia sp. Cj5 TaxID=2880978 RepID=UPI00351D583E
MPADQACSDPADTIISRRGRHRAQPVKPSFGRRSARAVVAAAATGTVALTALSAPALANDTGADSPTDAPQATAAVPAWAGDTTAAGATGTAPAEPGPATGATGATGAEEPARGLAGQQDQNSASTQQDSASLSAGSLGEKVVYLASKQAGKPYAWGAQGPNSFDCSGLVQYIYKQLGRSVPRVTDAQYAASRKISQDAKQPGDLIFFGQPGNIYHVGIYAGNEMMWAAPHSGTVVRLQKIYSASYLVGRLG